MKGFTFFENFFDSISDSRNGLTKEQEGEVYRAILYYVFRGEEIPLEGAGRMAFNLIRPSLDISRTRSAARRGGKNAADPGESETEDASPKDGTDDGAISSENQTQIKTQSKSEQPQIKSENLTFLEETETETSNVTLLRAPAREEDADGISVPGREEIGERIAAYRNFLSEHPDIVADLVNPDEITNCDWRLLGEKIEESRLLRQMKSLRWLVKNYGKIVHDAYKDFDPPPGGASAEEARRREEFLRAHHWVGEE